jgi:hypothetical protein
MMWCEEHLWNICVPKSTPFESCNGIIYQM